MRGPGRWGREEFQAEVTGLLLLGALLGHLYTSFE
jgi:hypothetical protein